MAAPNIFGGCSVVRTERVKYVRRQKATQPAISLFRESLAEQRIESWQSTVSKWHRDKDWQKNQGRSGINQRAFAIDIPSPGTSGRISIILLFILEAGARKAKIVLR